MGVAELETLEIEHLFTGEKRELQVYEIDRHRRTVFLIWPMAGHLEFRIDSGRGKGKASQWLLTTNSMAAALKILRGE